MHFALYLLSFFWYVNAVILERFVWLSKVVKQSVIHVKVIQQGIFGVFLEFATTWQTVNVVRALRYLGFADNTLAAFNKVEALRNCTFMLNVVPVGKVYLLHINSDGHEWLFIDILRNCFTCQCRHLPWKSQSS